MKTYIYVFMDVLIYMTSTMTRLLWFTVIWTAVTSQTYNETKRLRQYLFTDHDSSIRPVIDQSTQIQVGLEFNILTIIDFDMTNGRLETIGNLIMSWKDEILIWNETVFKDIPVVIIRNGEIWSPDIAQLDAIGEDRELTAIAVQNDGSALKGIGRSYITFCELNMRFYPVDEHVCTFEFISISDPAQYISIFPSTAEIDVSELKPHGEWKVKEGYIRLKSRQYQDLQSAGLEFVYVFQRRPGFSVLHKTVPLFILSFADIFIHMVPLNSGERISYAVTLLLAFVFWQAIVTEELPQNSSQISVLSALITTCMTLSVISTVTSVILCRIAYFDEDRPIPEFLQRLARRCRWKKRTCKKWEEKKKKKAKILSAAHHCNHHVKPEECDNEKGSSSNEESYQEQIERICKVTWTEAANAIDHIFLICHAVMSVFVIVVFVLIFAH